MRLQEFEVSFDLNGARSNVKMRAASKRYVLRDAIKRFPLGKRFEAKFVKYTTV